MTITHITLAAEINLGNIVATRSWPAGIYELIRALDLEANRIINLQNSLRTDAGIIVDPADWLKQVVAPYGDDLASMLENAQALCTLQAAWPLLGQHVVNFLSPEQAQQGASAIKFFTGYEVLKRHRIVEELTEGDDPNTHDLVIYPPGQLAPVATVYGNGPAAHQRAREIATLLDGAL